jgi:hypothetical protein
MSKKAKYAAALAMLLLALLLVTTYRYYSGSPTSGTEAPREPTTGALSGAEGAAPSNSSNTGLGTPPAEQAPSANALAGGSGVGPADGSVGPAVQKGGNGAGDTRATGVRNAGGTAPSKAKRAPSDSKKGAGSGTSGPGSSDPGSSEASAAASAQPSQPAEAKEAPKPEQVALETQCRNSVGASLRLVKLTYVLDGTPIFSQSGDKLAHGCEPFNRRLSPGNHELLVIADYQGTGYGVFSYHDSYRYKAQSIYHFAAREKSTTQITISLMEKGGVTTAVENRLAIGFKMNSRPASDSSAKP